VCDVNTLQSPSNLEDVTRGIDRSGSYERGQPISPNPDVVFDGIQLAGTEYRSCR
jgi:hypothetical protein